MQKIHIIIFLSLIICLSAGGYLIWKDPHINIPFVSLQRPVEWSIGIYVGKNPFEFNPPKSIHNPVLTAADVTDVPAEFVADPFMLHDKNTWYMFFEVMNAKTKQGDIGLATSDDGLHWNYERIVLDEAFHLSYSCVFKWKEAYYMVLEAHEKNYVPLYKANNFPFKWSFECVLLKGAYDDPTPFYYKNRWWMFAESNPKGNDTLRLYYADALNGPWVEHPKSPIIKGNANISRPGGRVIVFDGRIVRYAQDDDPTYGNQINAFEIILLTPNCYQEKEMDKNPILKASGVDWNANGIHQIDPHQVSESNWIACVDGYQKTGKLRFAFE